MLLSDSHLNLCRRVRLHLLRRHLLHLLRRHLTFILANTTTKRSSPLSILLHTLTDTTLVITVIFTKSKKTFLRAYRYI